MEKKSKEAHLNRPIKSNLLANRQFVFDGFEFFPCQQRLSYEGKPCQLEPKMLQLLAVLIENRPHVVTKEDLIRTLWPDAVVSDWSLARLISDTRKLIEDDGQQQSIIKTIRGKGFAFAAQVDEIIQAYPATDKDSAETKIHAHPDHKMHSHQSRRPISLTVITLFSITLIMIVFSAFYLNGNIIPSTNVHQRQGHYLEVMYEIQKNLRLTKSTYLAQKRRRTELKSLLLAKSPEKTLLSSEKRIRLHFPQLTSDERFIFDQIRAMTEGPMYQGNFAILQQLENHPEIYREIDTFHALYNHLKIWVNKYDRIFVKQPDMCFVFVGEEDGMPFPSEIDGLVDDWITKRINKTK